MFIVGYQLIEKMNTTEYWEMMHNISMVLERLDFIDNSKTRNLLMDKEFVSKNIKFFAIPSTNFTVDSCFTVHLPEHTNLQTISLSYLAEINAYFHYPGQFFYVWRDEMNIVTTSSKLIIKPGNTQVVWYDLNVNFLIEKYYGLPELENMNYDDCALGLKFSQNVYVEDFIVPILNSSNLFGKISMNDSSMEVLYDILSYADTYCSDPVDTARIQMLPAAMRQKRNIRINRDISLDTTYTEDLGLEKLKSKPKLIINIPRFSKVIKVSVKYMFFYNSVIKI